MEGSYYVLLSSILLQYIIVKTTDRFKTQTTFFSHTKVCQAMEHFLPSFSSPQASQDWMEFTQHTIPWLTSYPSQQADRSSFLDSGLDNSHTTEADLETYPPHGTCDFSSDLASYTSSKENSPKPSVPNISRLARDHLDPDPKLYDPILCQMVRIQEDPHSFAKIDGLTLNATFSNYAYIHGDKNPSQQLGAGEYGGVSESQDMPHRTDLPTDAAPWSSLDARGLGNPEDLASCAANSRVASVLHTAPTHQSSYDISHSNTLQPPPGFDLSYTPTTWNISPEDNSSHAEHSRTSTASCIHSTRHPTPNVTNLNDVVAARVSMPVEVKRKYNKRERSSISVRRNTTSQVSNPDNRKLSCTSTPCCLTPVVRDADKDDVIGMYTTLHDDPQEISNSLPRSGVRESSSLTPPNVLPAEPNRPAKKKLTKKADPGRVRKHRDARAWWTKPELRYFCVVTTCKCSQGKDFGGFLSAADARRHWACHGERKWTCHLGHVAGPRRFSRRDGLWS